ncbi:MAG: hypothetical protein KAR20_03450, partial [Candidatus Heimdallarchaeota archaeon]|nr:hypothetical protein [Candidatus Heimdallarchaeota archaeon]
MTQDLYLFFKSPRVSLSSLLIILTLSSWAQHADLKFIADSRFLQIPEGIYLKEVYDLAVNNQGELFVLSRGPHPISKFASDGSYLESFGE